MNILIVGTGVIGTLYGCALSEKHCVSHYIRKEKYEAFNSKTISYDLIDERQERKKQNTNGSYTYHCVTDASGNYDLIIVPVKTYQLKEVLTTLTSQAPDARYLLFTLDWDSQKDYDRLLKKEQYLMGYAGGGGSFRKDLLWANLGKDIMLGAVYTEQIPLLNTVTEMFKTCGILPEIAENPIHWLWIHNVGSAPLGAALSRCENMEELLKNKVLVKNAFRAMREGYSICEKRGVNSKQYAEVKMFSLPLCILYRMFRLNFTMNPVMQRYTAHATDSIDEMMQNFKDIYSTGLKLSIEMPYMKKLFELCCNN
jgi:2-dehydropantoate 2-reductase